MSAERWRPNRLNSLRGEDAPVMREILQRLDVYLASVQASIDELETDLGGVPTSSWGGYSLFKPSAGIYRWLPDATQNGTSTAGNMVNGDLYLTMIYTDVDLTFDRVGVRIVAAGSAGAVVRIGAFNLNANGLPGTVAWDAGTVSAENANTTALITINQTLTAGTTWWVGAVLQGNPGTKPTWITAHEASTPRWGSSSGFSLRGGGGLMCSGVTGALTASPSISNWEAGSGNQAGAPNMPSIGLRMT